MRKCFKSEHCSVLLGSRHLFYRCDNAITYHRYRDLLKLEKCYLLGVKLDFLLISWIANGNLTDDLFSLQWCQIVAAFVACAPLYQNNKSPILHIDGVVKQCYTVTEFLCNHSIIDECTLLRIQIPKIFTNFRIRIFSPLDPDPIFYLF